MNVPTLVVAALLLAGGPAAYYALAEPDVRLPGEARAAATEALAATAVPGRLVVRIHHDGDVLAARLGVAPADATPEMLAIELQPGDNVHEFLVDPALEHAIAFETEEASDPVGLFGGSVSGSGLVSFAECDAVEHLIQTLARDGSIGVALWGDACMPGPARHVAVESSGKTVAAPFPLCPLECSVQYSVGGSPRLEFDVPEGATRIDVLAFWSAQSPMTEELELWLAAPDDECGEGCWRVVAAERGAGEARLTLEAPQPGPHGVLTTLARPAGAAVDQDVWLHVAVHA